MTPYWASAEGDVTVYLADCLDVARSLPEASIDAIVTDPPGAVSFMNRQWDSDRGGRDRWVAWLAERMAEALRVLKPGGHAVVWSLPRTSHWTAWAIEDAGFEIRDCILHIFGSGFPKSLDVSKAIDKVGGQNVSWFGPWLRQERERRGISSHELCERGGFYKNVNHGGLVVNWELGLGIPTAAQFNKVCEILDLDYPRIEVLEREVLGMRKVMPGVAFTSDGPTELPVTAPATPEAARWDGWGTALKPGQEMWWLARKPLAAGSVASNVLAYGTGAINVDGCRIEGPPPPSVPQPDLRAARKKITGYDSDRRNGDMSQSTDGRWPPNLVFTHSAACQPAGTRQVRNGMHGQGPGGFGGGMFGGNPDVDVSGGYGTELVEVWDCADDCPVAELDRQSGSAPPSWRKGCGPTPDDRTVYAAMGGARPEFGYADTGGASRFFPVFRYQAKAPTSERPRLDAEPVLRLREGLTAEEHAYVMAELAKAGLDVS